MGERGWLALRARGVRAVVDLSDACGSIGSVVRQQGMRYLRLGAPDGLPEAEELHIVTSWVLHRIGEGGCVLINDSEGHGNDALLACAVLIKGGNSAGRAQARVRNVAGCALTEPQAGLLRRFVAQHALATNRPLSLP